MERIQKKLVLCSNFIDEGVVILLQSQSKILYFIVFLTGCSSAALQLLFCPKNETKDVSLPDIIGFIHGIAFPKTKIHIRQFIFSHNPGNMDGLGFPWSEIGDMIGAIG